MTRLLMLLLIVALTISSATAEPFRKVLSSVKQNVQVGDWKLSPADAKLKGNWSVRQRELHGGKQDGVRIIEVDNGTLQMTVVPTRGMSILRVVSGEVHLGWNSPVKEVVNPKFINLQSKGGLGWLDGFNEWMVRCGLESAGHPGKDSFTNNVGDEATLELTLHGKIGNIPASEVQVIVDDKPPHRIRIRGRVDERSFYGAQLEIWTEVSTVPGSKVFRIDDVITNRGAAEQEFQVIYHANHGAPLMEKGARLLAPVKRVTPFNQYAAKSVATWDVYPAPTPGFVERVYCLYPLADADGRTLVMLQNAAADKAVSFAYPVKQLPYLTQWKNALPLGGGYVTGIEPGTGFPANRSVERKAGRVPKLKPGQSRRFTLDVGLHAGGAAVKAVAAKIKKIQGDQKVQVDTKTTIVK